MFLFICAITNAIPQLLPSADDGEVPLPEGLFWLLMTGEIPGKDQVFTNVPFFVIIFNSFGHSNVT